MKRVLQHVFNGDGSLALTAGYDDQEIQNKPSLQLIDACPLLEFWIVIRRGWLALWEEYA